MRLPLGLDPAVLLALVAGGGMYLLTRSLWGALAGAALGYGAAFCYLAINSCIINATVSSTMPHDGAPTVVIYVPGLGVFPWMSWKLAWVWGDSVTDTRVVEVRPPWPWWMPFGDLGTPEYVAAVRAAIGAQATNATIWLVGESRGAGVILKAYNPAETRIKRVVMLMGPYDTVRGVLVHRWGRLLGLYGAILAAPFFWPHAFSHGLGKAHQHKNLFKFVTSETDTALPPAEEVDGELLVLPDAPHSIGFASIETKKRIRDFVWH
jgi:hypothetical protein